MDPVLGHVSSYPCHFAFLFRLLCPWLFPQCWRLYHFLFKFSLGSSFCLLSENPGVISVSFLCFLFRVSFNFADTCVFFLCLWIWVTLQLPWNFGWNGERDILGMLIWSSWSDLCLVHFSSVSYVLCCWEIWILNLFSGPRIAVLETFIFKLSWWARQRFGTELLQRMCLGFSGFFLQLNRFHFC